MFFLQMIALMAAVSSPATRLQVADTCPNSSFTSVAACTVSTNAPALDTACVAGYYSRGYFDLHRDTLGVRVIAQFGGTNVAIHVAESYRVVGLVAGTPFSFNVRMPVVPHLNPAGYSDVNTSVSGTAALELDGVVVAQSAGSRTCLLFDCTDSGNLSSTLEANVQEAAEQSFQVLSSLTISVTGNIAQPGEGLIEARVRFENLPPGTAIVSCHGDTVASGATVGVPRGQTDPSLAWLSVGANPTRGPIRAAFRAIDRVAAMVRLLDIAGREAERSRIDAPSSGSNAVVLGGPRLAPGVYVLRLEQSGRSVSRVVLVVR